MHEHRGPARSSTGSRGANLPFALLLAAMGSVLALLALGNVVLLLSDGTRGQAQADTGEAGAESTDASSDDDAADTDDETDLGSDTDPDEQEPVLVEGTGDDIVEIDPFVGLGIAHVTSSGSQIGVNAHSSEADIPDVLVSSEGEFDGRVLVNELDPDVVELEVAADGPWTVELLPVSSATGWDGTETSGTGPEVLDAAEITDAGAVHATHTTEDSDQYFGVFGIRGIAADESSQEDLVLNEVGEFEGTGDLAADVELVVVDTDASWTLRLD